MTRYYKAVRPDGTDFHTGTVRWAPPVGHEGEWIVRHPTATVVGDGPGQYLSVATVPTDCTGMSWPCRLLLVEPVGFVTTPEPEGMPNKRAGVAFRVVEELDEHHALGPQGGYVAALIERVRVLSTAECERLAAAWCAAGSAAWSAAWDAAWSAARDAEWDAAWDAAWSAARDATWDAAGSAARDAAWDAAWSAARDATWDAARALVVRDLISAEHYDTLTAPWRTSIGPIHPEDPDLRAPNVGDRR